MELTIYLYEVHLYLLMSNKQGALRLSVLTDYTVFFVSIYILLFFSHIYCKKCEELY